MAKNIKSRKRWTKTLQFFAAYLVAAWTILQFVDWIITRYQLSPHWVDMLLWIFIGVIPSLFLYINNQERIKMRVLSLKEKIIIPANLILILAVLFFGFESKDLSAKTKEISFSTETGKFEYQTILKNEYRTGIPFFNFDQKSNDSTNAWISYAIPYLLKQDLLQDKNVNTEDLAGSTTTDKVNAAKSYKFYVDGTYEIKDGIYTVIPTLRNSTNGKLVASKLFKNNDLLQLLDSVSIYVRAQAGITEAHRDQYTDLKLEEFMSSNLEAIKYYIKSTAAQGWGKVKPVKKSMELDSTFSYVYLQAGKQNLWFNLGILETQLLLDNAFKFRNKLPLYMQFEVMLYRYLASKEWGKAEQYAKLQLEIHPKNSTLRNILFNIYAETNQLDAYYELAKEYYNNDPTRGNLFWLNGIRLCLGKTEEAVNSIKELIQTNPTDTFLKLNLFTPLVLNGDVIEARKTLNEINALWPEKSNTTKIYENLFDYLTANKVSDIDLSVFEGEYANLEYELIQTINNSNGILLKHTSNQHIRPVIIAGPNKTMSTYNGGRSSKSDFILDENGQVYLNKQVQYDNNNQSWINYGWKLDENIKKAEELFFKNGDLAQAEDAYKIAIAANPNHLYLKDVLKHIQYVKKIGPEALKKQYDELVGKYGNRKVWLENDKLYIKHELRSRHILYPINKTRYINHSLQGYQYEFEYKNDISKGLFIWNFNAEDMTWEKLDVYSAKD